MRILLALILTLSAWAAIPANAIWHLRSDATASNVNGGFFNTGNANFPTDGTVDTNTGNTNSPVFSSASYNFVAGDVGAWIFIKSGTNTYPGFYQIASVASNKATLTASVGTAVLFNESNRTYTTSTAAGIASVGTPSSITWGINYSWGTAAINSTTTDLASTIGTTNPCTVTSAGSPFGINHVGNGLRVSAGTNWTQDWYEIVSVSGSTATLDKACGSAASISSGTFRVGGAMSMNSTLDDDLFEKGIAGNDFLVKSGTYTIGEAVSIGTAAGGAQNPIRIIGYNSLPSDKPTGSTRPIFNTGASNSFVFAQTKWQVHYMQFTGSASPFVTLQNDATVTFSKFTNTSTTAGRPALSVGSENYIFACEMVSYRGNAVIASSSANSYIIKNSWIHDSDTGILASHTNGNVIISGNIISGNVTYGIRVSNAATGSTTIENNTLFGADSGVSAATGLGVGISVATGATDMRITNNIIKGFTTGISITDSTQTIGFDAYNFFHGNGTNVSGWILGTGSSSGTDPAFTNVTQTYQTGGSSSTNVLTAGTGTPFTSVVDGVDYITIYSGSGTGFATGKYPISSHTNNTVTLATPLGTALNITSSGSGTSIEWELTSGRDFSIGTALKALGFPGAFPAGLTTGYTDPGGVQRQEAGGGGTRIY